MKMLKLAPRDVATLAGIRDELETIRLSGPPVLDAIFPELRQLLEVECLLAIRMCQRGQGWNIDLFHFQGMQRPEEFKSRLLNFFAKAPPRFAWYNATCPEPSQRNKVIEAVSRIPPGEFETSKIYHDVLKPLRMQNCKQLRALVCPWNIRLK